MKKGIHPSYHFVDVLLNDGSTYRTRTTWGTPGGKLTLDIDPTTRPGPAASSSSWTVAAACRASTSASRIM